VSLESWRGGECLIRSHMNSKTPQICQACQLEIRQGQIATVISTRITHYVCRNKLRPPKGKRATGHNGQK